MPDPFTTSYHNGVRQTGGPCPIEAGVAGRLADHECHCGRLPFDRTPPCGCWPQEPAAILPLPARPAATAPRRRRAA
jgi:hypothetical protein